MVSAGPWSLVEKEQVRWALQSPGFPGDMVSTRERGRGTSTENNRWLKAEEVEVRIQRVWGTWMLWSRVLERCDDLQRKRVPKTCIRIPLSPYWILRRYSTSLDEELPGRWNWRFLRAFPSLGGTWASAVMERPRSHSVTILTQRMK